MIDSETVTTFIGYAIGSFAIGYISGFAFLAFKKAAGILR